MLPPVRLRIRRHGGFAVPVPGGIAPDGLAVIAQVLPENKCNIFHRYGLSRISKVETAIVNGKPFW